MMCVFDGRSSLLNDDHKATLKCVKLYSKKLSFYKSGHQAL